MAGFKLKLKILPQSNQYFGESGLIGGRRSAHNDRWGHVIISITFDTDCTKSRILVNRAEVKGFLMFDHFDRYPEARKALAEGARNGDLKFKTDFMDGIENMPEAFLKLLRSQNMGKQLVRTELAGRYSE